MICQKRPFSKLERQDIFISSQGGQSVYQLLMLISASEEQRIGGIEMFNQICWKCINELHFHCLQNCQGYCLKWLNIFRQIWYLAGPTLFVTSFPALVYVAGGGGGGGAVITYCVAQCCHQMVSSRDQPSLNHLDVFQELDEETEKEVFYPNESRT